MEIRVEVGDAVLCLLGQLALGLDKVDRDERRAAPALQPGVGLPRVRDESIEAGPQERAEARLRRIESAEKVLLERPQEERLGQIGGLLGRRAPLEPHVLERRLPVRLRERVECRAAHVRPIAADGGNHGVARRRK